MPRRVLYAVALFLMLASFGSGAIRWANDAGAAYHRTDFASIGFKLNISTAQTIVSDGDPLVAIQGALNSWNSVPYTALHFAPLELTSAGINSSDGLSVISLADSAASRSAVGSALAVTMVFSTADGRVTDTDIILNPNTPFSTRLQPNTIDLQSVITHELGHALGANHSVVISATMFHNTGRGDNFQTQIKADDASFAVDVYPGPGADAAYGLIKGTATKDGAVLTGASIIAVDEDSGAAVGGLSSVADGSFALRVPAGNYTLLAAPLSGFVQAGSLYNIPASKVDTGFKAVIAGGAGDASTIRVASGATAAASIMGSNGTSAIGIAAVGTAVAQTSFELGPMPVAVQSGAPFDLLVSGPGLDGSIAEQDIRLIGPGATIHSGTLHVDSLIRDGAGRAPLRFTVDLAPRSSRAAVTIFIAHGTDTALLAGAIVILPPKPAFSAPNLVDAGSFQGAGVAPGELISLFGTGVGPDSPVSNSGFDPATGALPTTLAGVSVTFDGVPAPLVFVSANQINLQVPYEIAGRASTVVVVQNQGSFSDLVTKPVVSSQPGLFVQAGTSQAIAINQDGSVNSASRPAPRGSVLTLFATGPGVVNPPVLTGKPASGSPLSSASSVSVTIAGQDAKVLFGGLAPGFVGLMQVNIELPQGVPSGAAAVQLSVSGRISQTGATIAVQ